MRSEHVDPSPSAAGEVGADGLGRRLFPLYVAAFLGALALWVPIEKLFMTTIGFDPASVGVMAAVYAVVVPVLEVPSGLLADRWSRRGVLLLASIAAIASVVIGGLSQSVMAYMVSAAFLGVFFALQSGTFESVVYDTVLEETSDSDAFERTIGRVRLVESVGLVMSALIGGAIAEMVSLRATYFLTAPLLLSSGAALLLFREPQLHKAEEREPLRQQIRATYRTIFASGSIRAIVALVVATAVLMQGMLEFGPLWLVALAVPPFLYGPHWAALTSALGIGGLLGGQAWLTRPLVIWIVGASIVACSVVLVMSELVPMVIGVQVLLTLLVVAAGIPVTRRLHDNVPSSIRAGVASGVGTLTWFVFIPFALVFGIVSERAGVERAGWFFVAIGVAAALLILVVLPQGTYPVAQPSDAHASPRAAEPVFSEDRFLPRTDPEWPGHWARPPVAWSTAGLPIDGPEALDVARATIAQMPSDLRRVIVLRDVEGRSPGDVRDALTIGPSEEAELLKRARALVRDRLERYAEGPAMSDER